MSRKIHEAVRIQNCPSLNSKSEWGNYKISRLSIEPTEKERRKEAEMTEKVRVRVLESEIMRK